MRGDKTELSLVVNLRLVAMLLVAANILFAAAAATAAPAIKAAFITDRGAAAAPSGAAGICQTYNWACARIDQSVAPDKRFDLVRSVNARVNHSVPAINDDRQYGVEEYWALPTQSGGDCEDFALLKKRELIAAGVSPQRLFIATTLDSQRNPHAVLVFRSDDGDFVLDNLTDSIRRWYETSYMFLLMQDPARPAGWVKIYASG